MKRAIAVAVAMPITPIVLVGRQLCVRFGLTPSLLVAGAACAIALFLLFRHRNRNIAQLATALVALALFSGVSRPAGACELAAAPTSDGKSVQLVESRGGVVVLTFFSRYSGRDAEQVNDALERALDGHRAALVSVFDLTGIPSGFHGFARRRIASAAAGRRIQYRVDATPDWSRAFDAHPTAAVETLVLDGVCRVRGRFVGARDVTATLRLVDELSVGSRVALR